MTPTQAKALLQRIDGLMALAGNDPPAASRQDNEAAREAVLWLREVAEVGLRPSILWALTGDSTYARKAD